MVGGRKGDRIRVDVQQKIEDHRPSRKLQQVSGDIAVPTSTELTRFRLIAQSEPSKALRDLASSGSHLPKQSKPSAMQRVYEYLAPARRYALPRGRPHFSTVTIYYQIRG
eukprot:749332-Hanusia_phi.AAC.8